MKMIGKTALGVGVIVSGVAFMGVNLVKTLDSQIANNVLKKMQPMINESCDLCTQELLKYFIN